MGLAFLIKKVGMPVAFRTLKKFGPPSISMLNVNEISKKPKMLKTRNCHEGIKNFKSKQG